MDYGSRVEIHYRSFFSPGLPMKKKINQKRRKTMFCFQCQETARNAGCTKIGVCGKQENTSNLMDLLIYVLKGISLIGEEKETAEVGHFLSKALFVTITNANFDSQRVMSMIREALALRESLRKQYNLDTQGMHDSVTWTAEREEDFIRKAQDVGVLSTENEDVRSLRELLIYGLKGIAAYAHHAAVLGKENKDIYRFMMKGLASTTRDLTVDEMVSLVLNAGETAVSVMALLDEANTSAYGNPEISEVNIGVGTNPGILVSGHGCLKLNQGENHDRQNERNHIEQAKHLKNPVGQHFNRFYLKEFSHFFRNLIF